MEGIHSHIVEFLTKEFSRGEHRQCVLLELSSGQSGMPTVPINTWDRKEEPALFEGLSNIEGLASEIVRRAEGWANDNGGKQRFVLRTEQHLGGRARTSFVITSEDGGEASGDDTPTATGLVAQLMRHNEVNVRMMATMFQSSLGTMSRTLADITEENRQLRNDRSRQLTELEESRSRQAERDIDLFERDASNKRKDQAFGKVIQLLPVVASKIIGGDGTGNGPTGALEILLGELAESLSDEQVKKIAGTLHSTQAVLLAEALSVAKKSKAMRDSAAQAESGTGDKASSGA